MYTIHETVPELEQKRIEVLKRHEILDSPPDATLNILTKLAARSLKMPIGIVTLVDTNRICLHSRFGLDLMVMGKETGLCSTAILKDEMYIVGNALEDKRTKKHPLVLGKFGLRFYAAVPLKVKEGCNLGTLCIMDKKARVLSVADKEILNNLADLVRSHLDIQLAFKTAVNHHHHILNATVHDLKNPLSVMPLLADLIIHNKNNPQAIDDIALQIKDVGNRMSRLIGDLLESAVEGSGKVKLRLKTLHFSCVVRAVIRTNSSLANFKQQTVHLDIQKDCVVYADQDKLREIVDNLINNAIKYSPLGKEIFVSVRERDGHAILEVKDQGPGLTKDDMRYLFQSFTSLSAQPTGGEVSTGLGLSIAKNLVEAHQGTIRAECEGPGKGARFIVEIPLSETV